MNGTSVAIAAPAGGALTAAELRAQVNRIQEVVKAVMIGPTAENPAGVHYGKIPGTPKPTLYKPGAEVLCTTFRIAPKFIVEDLSTADCYRYRVTCRGVHQQTDIVLAEGMGSASSSEEKYKWRASLCDEEFEITPEDRKRVKFKKGPNSVYKVKQIRAEPDDIDNTVLKMACKRAQVAMTLNATAASDMFTQDIEDLPDEMRDEHEAEQVHAGGNGKKSASRDDSKKPSDLDKASDGQIAYLKKQLKGEDGAPSEAEALKAFGITTLEGITVAQWKGIRKWIDSPTSRPEATPQDAPASGEQQPAAA